MSEGERDRAPAGEPLAGPLGEMAGAYHRPPPVPAQSMWSAIEGRVREESRRRAAAAAARADRDAEGASTAIRREPEGDARLLPLRPTRRLRAAPRWAVGAAAAIALLGLGVGIGRRTAPAPAGEEMARADAPAIGSVMRAATVEHLSRSEALLTLVRSDARTGRVDPVVGGWGRELLVETRLLLDSSAGRDPALRRLLEDLELILAQVALLGGERPGEGDRWTRDELDIIARGMDVNDMLPRIQAAVPATAGLTGT